jgi:regulator of sirC expression with transglutaminase-like and TPR domain
MLETLALMDDEDIALDEAALALAALDHPDADLDHYTTRMAYFAAQLLARSAGVTASAERAVLLRDLLAHEHELTGDERCFSEESGADLIALLDSGRGLPVTLSLLYVAVARKAGWTAVCLNVPGHVLIRIGREPSSVIQDPFDEGRVLDQRALARMTARLLGPGAAPETAAFPPMGNRATLVRLITNQAARARRLGKLDRALELTTRMCALAPRMTALWWERARLEQHLGRTAAARASLVAMRETTRDRAMTARVEAALKALAAGSA